MEKCQHFDRDIISWIESPGLLTSTEITQRMLSVFMPDIINADYLDLVRQARAPCFVAPPEFVIENVTDKLFAVNSVSLLTLLPI
jgi:hypothetical protein